MKGRWRYKLTGRIARVTDVISTTAGTVIKFHHEDDGIDHTWRRDGDAAKGVPAWADAWERVAV